MPTLLTKNGFRFFFYSNEFNEPPHVHVVGRNGEAKIWLTPTEISRSYGLKSKDLNDILIITIENVNLFLEEWSKWHGSSSKKN